MPESRILLTPSPAPRRYARQTSMPEIGVEGQRRLKAASVVVVGLGGLGGPVAHYLAAAGVGRIGLVDHDRVDESNLHRQTLYDSSMQGMSKAQAARARLAAVNPEVELVVHEERLTSRNALRILGAYDVVVDASDNFPTRYLVNDASVLLGKPDVYASLLRFEGQASVFWAAKGPCYRCLQPSPPPPGSVPTCAEAGVLGPVAGILGAIQATEALKLLLNVGEPLVGRLLLYEGLGQGTVTVKLSRDPSCAACGASPTMKALIDYEAFCGEQPPMPAENPTTITPQDLKRLIDEKADFVLLDVRQMDEYEFAHLPGSLLIPTSEFQAREAELEPHRQREIVVMCHTGSRSNLVSNYLRKKGYPRVRNLVGGIARWSAEVDPTVPTY